MMRKDGGREGGREGGRGIEAKPWKREVFRESQQQSKKSINDETSKIEDQPP